MSGQQDPRIRKAEMLDLAVLISEVERYEDPRIAAVSASVPQSAAGYGSEIVVYRRARAAVASPLTAHRWPAQPPQRDCTGRSER